MPSACLTATELDALLMGNVVAADSARLDDHLRECAACRQKLNALAGGDESWLKVKQSIPLVPVDSPPLREAMNHLKAGDPMPPSEKPGDRIGRYKILEQIGEGGCGVVYVAEQEEPVRRRVALKVIKLGMDTKQVIARFEAERQALAMMDHPNIARVLDAGAMDCPHPQPLSHPMGEGGRRPGEGLPAGRPYFVMELVRGVKITDYCDENKLDTARRLDLFIQVCQAVQHAHQKGIIHRDLKPSNILVTINDGVPVPKVIDFGIAKATEGRLTDKTVYTQLHQFIGTPTYMSPEQALMTSLDIDTRSDIYSLGVLLYELLTGSTPLDTPELLKAGVDEMRRTIREVEPARPSTRLSVLPREDLTTAAKRRSTNSPQLIHAVSGDLDWIVMKCLEKDRTRRYDTANGLAADIQRHLKNEPVVACPPSNFYRFQKLVRRNKLAFTAGTAVAASLVIGLTLSTVLFFGERTARKHANEQAAIAKAVNDFLKEDLLRQASSYSQASTNFTPDPNLTVRTALERAAERIGDRFKDQPLQQAAVRMTIGEALLEIGETEQAVTHLQQALELRQTKLGPQHPDALTSAQSLANAYRLAGKLDQALPLVEETLKLRRTTLEPQHPDTLSSMGLLGLLHLEAGNVAQALPLLEESLQLRKAKLGLQHRSTLLSMGWLANAYRRAGKLDQALALLEETLTLRKATLGPAHPQTLLSMGNLAGVYSDAGQFDQALRLCEQVLELRKATLGPDNPETLESMYSLATIYSKAGKSDEAVPLFETTLKLQRAKLPPDHPDTLKTMNNLGIEYSKMGKLDQAVRLFEETVRLIRTKVGFDPQQARYAMYNLENAYRKAGKLDQLEALYEETLKLTKAKLGPDHPATLASTCKLALVLADQGKLAEAETLLAEALGRQRKVLGNDHQDVNNSLYDLALMRRAQGKLAEALEALRAAAQNDHGPALNDLAWLLATSTDPALRDGRSAVGYAEQAVAKTERKNPGYLDTLAAAYAEAGEFAKAANVQREAIGLCQDEKIKRNLAARLKLYESNAPFRE